MMGTVCTECGMETTQGVRHHESYLYQISRYVCHPCHRALHSHWWLDKEEREAKARMDYIIAKGD